MEMTKAKAARIRVMLADDHPIVMGGFAMSLAAPDIDVVAQARTPEEAIETFDAQRPDVLVLDIRFGSSIRTA
jgi:two-component system invasion response regulator UvrY